MEASNSIIKNIPKEAWGASIDLINKLVFPVTAITVGVGKLIEQKFSTLNEVQKIIAEQTIKEAIKKFNKKMIKIFLKLLLNLK